MIRGMQPEDLEVLKRIHEENFSHEFLFPEFLKHYMAAFVCEHDGEIVCGGGIRLIPEVITLTDKRFSPRIRKKALLDIMQASYFVADKEGFKEMHAFVQDPTWIRHLLKVGFRGTKGEALVFSF